MDNIIINLHDFSVVKDDIGSEGMECLSKIWPEESLDDECRITLFCKEVQRQVREAKSKNINLLVSSEESNPILFKDYNGEKWTQGYVGSIGVRIRDFYVTVNFHSRFDKDNSNFLMYIFEKAFDVKGKIYEELEVKGKSEKVWDLLLILLFVKQMHEAMKKGLYKQYQEFMYNDSNVKGRIDIARHIKENMLSNGKVCYVTREFSVDNPVNKLLLKTCEFIEKRYRRIFNNLLANDEICKKGISLLKSELYDWNTGSVRDIIKKADKKVVNSVFREYEPLRKTAIAILKRLGIDSFKCNDGTAEGILIDMPGLWELFLYRELFCKITGEEKKYTQNEYDILEKRRTVKPDFLINKKIVFDAKYKKHWSDEFDRQSWSDKVRKDTFQVLSYMYLFDSPAGGVIFPVSKDNEQGGELITKLSVGQEQKDRFFLTVPIYVPMSGDAVVFRQDMDTMLSRVREELKDVMDGFLNEKQGEEN